MCGGGGDGSLFNTTIVECACGAMEGDGVAGVSFYCRNVGDIMMRLLRSRYVVRGWWICVEYVPYPVLHGDIPRHGIGPGDRGP